MIPKVVHYCWFGKQKKPFLAQKCIKSWHNLLPDYRFIEWNEDNFPSSLYPYAEYCLKSKKYAFLSDFVRLVVINKHGGIYFDTDVELCKSPDLLLKYPAFFGFENDRFVATGLGFGAEKSHKTVKYMLQQYLDLKADENGSFPLIVCPKLNTDALTQLGLERNGKMQFVQGAIILPSDYLNPFDDATGVLKTTENTISIHWFGKSWMSKKKVIRSRITRPVHRILGVDFFRKH